MSALFRPLLLLLLVVGGLVAIPRGAAVAVASHNPQDNHVLGMASVKLGHQTFGQVLSWLRHQPTIRSAARGKDGHTLEIVFRDGTQSAILPRKVTGVRIPTSVFHRDVQTQAPGVTGQAVVMEPYATELGLGPNVGDVEVQYLQSAGFHVDQLYDTAVTVESMKTLPQYNVVYMQTHAGVSNGGEGIVATGQKADGDPTVVPYLRNGTVITVAVSGSATPYYAITSSFITTYETQFPAHSLLFFNGCDVLSSSRFWGALSAKGAGVMVSWNLEATSTANFIAGAEFFKSMAVTGTTVDAAIHAVQAAGAGTSTVNGQKASLAYLGDGNVTLQSAANAPVSTAVPPTATPVSPAATATPPSGPTATPVVLNPTATPTRTATPVPSHALSLSVKSKVWPGSLQVIKITASPKTQVHIRVAYPNGDQQFATRTTGAAGLAVFQYRQASSEITRNSHVATVFLTTKAGTVSKKYQVPFNHIDVSVQPRAQWPGRKTVIWVHSTPYTRVAALLLFPNHTRVQKYGKTGAQGWAYIPYWVAKNKIAGKSHKTVVVGDVLSRKPHYTTRTFLTIR